jgi:hypothetical protein
MSIIPYMRQNEIFFVAHNLSLYLYLQVVE